MRLDAKQEAVEQACRVGTGAALKTALGAIISGPLSTIRLIKSDPEAMEAQREDIKARYRSIFGA